MKADFIKTDKTISSLKEYIEKNLGDDCGNWEYEHRPYIKLEVGSFTREESEKFSQEIWSWPDTHLYELADAIIFGGNKHLESDLIYCRIFQKIYTINELQYLAQNLPASFYSLKFNALDDLELLKIKLNIKKVLDKGQNESWTKEYTDLIYSIESLIKKK